jgi:DNA repair protein RadC
MPVIGGSASASGVCTTLSGFKLADPSPKPGSMNEDDIDAKGHRERLRKRLLDHGPDALLDHELVEYLLTLVIPRVDTKPRAKALIREFGGIGPLFSADGETLMRAGLSEREASAIKIAEASALRMLKSEIIDRPVLSGWQALIDYLTADMAHRAIERVRVLHLNGKISTARTR